MLTSLPVVLCRESGRFGLQDSFPNVVRLKLAMMALRKNFVRGVLVLAISAQLAACAGASFNGVEYRDEDVAFRLGPVPAGMREIDSSDARVSFQDDQVGATVAVAARCGVDSDDVPLRALVQHLFLQFTDRQLLSEKKYQLDGRAALEVDMRAKLDGVPRRFIVTVIKKDGCVYDFLHIDGGGNRPELEQSRSDFRKMVSGFHTVE